MDPRMGMALVFALSIAMRLALGGLGGGPLTRMESQSMRDALDYKALAWHWSQGYGYTLNPDGPGPSGTNRAPLYPVLLSLAAPQALTSPWTGGRVLGVILGACIPVACWVLARETRGPRAAILAGLLAAVYPFLILYSLLLLTETLFTLLSACALVLWIRARGEGGSRRALLLGMSLGLACLTRPVLLPISLFAAADVALSRRKLARGLVVLVGIGACVCPWMMHLRVVTGRWIPITTEGGRSFYQGNNPMNRTGGAMEGVDYAYPEWAIRMGEVDSSRALMAEGMRYVKDRPWAFLHRALLKTLRLWSVTPSSASGFGKAWMKWANLAIDGPLIGVAILSIVIFPGSRRSEMPCVAMVLYTTLFCAVFTGSQRFRLPLTPILIVWAAGGMEGILDSSVAGYSQFATIVARSILDFRLQILDWRWLRRYFHKSKI